MKIKLLIAYDGTDFEGWQRQKSSRKPTVQETLENELSRIFNSPIKVVASGRTDTGVHAVGQVVHFVAPKPPPKTLVRGLNGLLPGSIAVKRAWIAPNQFNALASAEGKTYRYLIHNSPIPDPFRIRYMAWFKKSLSIEKLNALAEPLVGELDFKSFQTTGTAVKTTVRSVSEAKWTSLGDNVVEFRITGTGFLKQMVRNIVGTLLYLHQNDGTPQDVRRILDSKNRSAAKTTAPPEGLYLDAVYYPADLDNECREL